MIRTRWLIIAAVASAALTFILAAHFVSNPRAGADPFDFFTPTPKVPKATATPSATPFPTPQPLPPDGSASGPGVMLAECTSSGRSSVRVIFLWGPSTQGPQWLDLSIFNNGFAPGTFVGAGGFAPAAWGFVWEGIAQGTTHYARVNTLTPSGWRESGTHMFFTPVCDRDALEPDPAADMLHLRDRIDAAIAASGINTAVAITDLRTGETIDVNGDAVRLPGCTINLFAIMRTVVDLQAGRYDERAPGDVIGQTINRSDPITARVLMKDFVGEGDIGVGVARVDDYIHALGMTNSFLDHPPAFTAPALYGGIDNRITARDTNRGLQALWDARALNEGWRDYLLRKMTLVKPGLNYLIPAGVGYGATVSHKNGFLYAEGWADNDIGIVWFERAGQRYGYAISFFTEFVPTKYADISLGQQISSLAWQWFVGRYGYP